MIEENGGECYGLVPNYIGWKTYIVEIEVG